MQIVFLRIELEKNKLVKSGNASQGRAKYLRVPAASRYGKVGPAKMAEKYQIFLPPPSYFVQTSGS